MLNQPENVLKVFLKLFLKLKYSVDYQQMKSMTKHNIFNWSMDFMSAYCVWSKQRMLLTEGNSHLIT